MIYKISGQYPKKRAFITGAGSGLGLSLALELAKDGWTLGLADLRKERVDEAARQVEKLGGKGFAYSLDVSDKTGYKIVAENFLEKVGIDVLINNAGVGDGGLIEEYGMDNWDWLVNINLMGVVYGCSLFVPYLKKQQSGCVVNISSAASYGNAPKMSAYNCTKAAVYSISETIYTELALHNVKVSVVMPLFFKTQLMDQCRGGKEVEEMSEMLMTNAQLGPEEVAVKLLKGAGQGKFHIHITGKAAFLFHFKRFFPGLFRKIKTKGFLKEDAYRAKIEKKYKKLKGA